MTLQRWPINQAWRYRQPAKRRYDHGQDPAAGKPVGPPFQVSKFDTARLMIPRWIPPVGLSLTQDKLVMTMAEESGSIWILDNVDR